MPEVPRPHDEPVEEAVGVIDSDALDAQGVVIRDLPCRKCGYNLRGLAGRGNCPECATPVGRALAGDLLEFAEPEWLETLRRGVHVILAAVALGVLLGCFGGIAAAGAAAAGMTVPARAGEILGMILGLAGALVNFLGAWWLTTPDPSGLGESEYGRARRIVRVTLLIGLTSFLPQVLLAIVPAALMFVLMGWQVLTGIVSAVGQWFLLAYLSKLATRIPDEKLARRARVLKWLLAIGLAVMAVAGGLALVTVAGGGGGAGAPGAPVTTAPAGPAAAPGVGLAGIGAALGCVAAPVALVVYIVYLVMLMQFGRAFDTAARRSRARAAVDEGVAG